MDEPGTFAAYIGTEPENLKRVKTEILEELNRIRDKPPTAAEVEDAKSYLLGSQAFQFTTSGLIAAQLIHVERFHLGLNYFEDFRKAVAAVTPADVQEVAKKYIDPKHIIIVAAGAVDKTGKVLEEEKK